MKDIIIAAFTRRMALLTFIILCCIPFFHLVPVGYNQIIGFWWNVTAMKYVFIPGLISLSFLCYLILAAFKKRTHLYLSVVHYMAMAAIMLMLVMRPIHHSIFFIAIITIIVLLIANTVWSIKSRSNDNNYKL